jgi:hypothetical protein
VNHGWFERREFTGLPDFCVPSRNAKAVNEQ